MKRDGRTLDHGTLETIRRWDERACAQLNQAYARRQKQEAAG